MYNRLQRLLNEALSGAARGYLKMVRKYNPMTSKLDPKTHADLDLGKIINLKNAIPTKRKRNRLRLNTILNQEKNHINYQKKQSASYVKNLKQNLRKSQID